MARLRPICLVCALVFIAAKSGAENPHNAVLHSRDPWERTLRELYDRSQAAAGFCFGSDPFKLFRAAITLSFPWPLPAQGDSIHDACSSYPNITLHLCTPDDVLFYYKFLLRTNDPEKAPGTAACPVGTSKPPCAPGFFGINGTAHACCAGYFCPRGLQCMMPCPLGAHCPAAVPALPPKPYQGRSSGATGLWCAPYAYRLRSTKDGVGRCGGADRWTIVPELAFPGAQWDAGSGNLYCEGRYYCPNTTARVLCPRGYFCKQGSTLPEHCPPGSLCPPGTEVPLNNYGGFTADLLLLGVMATLWLVAAYYRGVMQRLDPEERLRVVWRPWPALVSVVTAHPHIDDSTIVPGWMSPAALHPSSANSSTTSTAPWTVQDLLVLEVEFRHLGLRMRTGTHRQILSDVSAKFQGARLTAILGPSGAGKSTLLCLLAGRMHRARVEVAGEVLVNGRRDRLERYSHVLGFVPQDDIMHSTLTVEENLMFSARYRLPRECTAAERRRRVDGTLHALGLAGVRRELVGDQAVRGISGGQRKRVNIGIELVAAPRLLLLDEPTSGLDASAAAALVATLLSVVRSQQVTTAAAVHQPRHEAFSLFDDLLLLGKSGRTAYYGPVAEVEGYLLGLGLEIPLHTNPADAIMDLLSGERVGSGDVATGPDVLVNAWEERSRGATSDEGQEGSAAHDDAPIDIEEAADGEVSSESSWIPVVHPEGGLGYHPLPAAPPTQPPPLPSHSPSSKTEAVALHHHRTAPGFIQQFWWCLQRAALKRSREPLQAFLDVSLVALTGLTVGLLSDRGRASIMSYAANITFSVVALSLLAMVGAVPTFSQDALAFRREAASGLHRGAFFCALDVFDLMGSCVRVGAYLVMWVSFASPRAVLWQLYLVAVALFYACTGTAYVLSLSVGPSTAQLASAVITLVATLVARQVGARGAVYAAQQFTFSRWALEGLVIAESNRLTGVWLLARCADLAALGYDVRRFWLCLTALVGQGLAARAAAYCLLLRE